MRTVTFPDRALRSVGIAALAASIGVGMTSNVLFLAAFQFRLDWFLEPSALVGAGPASAELLRWAAVLDLFGYYLASGVLAYVLWRVLRPRNALVADLTTLAALAYTVAGGAGAAVLAFAGPSLMHGYAAAPSDERAAISTLFATLIAVVWRAVWQFFDGLLVGAWWLGIGLLVRADLPGLARLSLTLAALAGVGVLLNQVGLAIVRDIGLGVVFALWTAWWIWLLVLFVGSGNVQPARRRRPAIEPRAAAMRIDPRAGQIDRAEPLSNDNALKEAE